MDTKQVVARFDSERQALALMDHPAIAKVFDGGSTAEGRPYFVMEYVPGIPIHEYCDVHRLSTAARLQLFIEVCEGVQHAHQKAIIHRDLKPSNILVSLVDGKAQVKIIDFGIAKATGSRLTDKTLFTELGAIIGTPEYMSPEQADFSQDIDTRTDVYALGVVLYQLLTGELPFSSQDLRSSSYEELRRKLKEVEPPRPSTKLGTLGDAATRTATSRDTDPGALRHQLEGDLDAITMKALEKERDRRYGTPSELAQDVARHLRNEAVIARPASTAYRIRKYVRRHRVGVGLATGLAVLLVGFAVAMGVQARRTTLERDRANSEREASEKVSAFLANMLGSVNPEELGNTLWKDLRERAAAARRKSGATEEKVSASLASLDEALAGVSSTQTGLNLLDQQILDRAGKTIATEMAGEPRIAGRLEDTLGRTYLLLGLLPQAEAHLKAAVDIRTRAFGADSPDTLKSMRFLGMVYGRQGKYPEAEKISRESLETLRRTLGSEHPDTLGAMQALGIVYYWEQRYELAEKLFRECLEGRRRVLGPDHRDTRRVYIPLGMVLSELKRYPEAEKLLLDQVEFDRKAGTSNEPDAIGTVMNLAITYEQEGRFADARKLQEEVLARFQKRLGPDHPDTVSAMINIASTYLGERRFAEAEGPYRETLEAARRVLGPDHPETLKTMSNFAEVEAGLGKNREAEALYRRTLEVRRRTLPADHPLLLSSLTDLARIRSTSGQHADAATLAREALSGYERVKDVEGTASARLALGRALTGLARYTEAEPELLGAEQALADSKGPVHTQSIEALAAMYQRWEGTDPGKGHAAQAAAWKAKAGAR
ncbi:MAG: tetratricopeptide repeat protein, partial [Myxococcaceae bacterium]